MTRTTYDTNDELRYRVLDAKYGRKESLPTSHHGGADASSSITRRLFRLGGFGSTIHGRGFVRSHESPPRRTGNCARTVLLRPEALRGLLVGDCSVVFRPPMPPLSPCPVLEHPSGPSEVLLLLFVFRCCVVERGVGFSRPLAAAQGRNP